MKKLRWALLIIMALTLALGASAMAATAVAINGKVYTFLGNETVFQADGMTFILEGNTVRIQQPGKADTVLPLSAAEQSVPIQDVGNPQSSPVIEAAISTDYLAQGTAGQAVDASSGYTLFSEHKELDAASYEIYAQYGLTYDAASNSLYYQGKRVRVFEDLYFINTNTAGSLVHFDAAGVVDVEPQRDYLAGGALTGLRALNDTEFASRDISSWTEPRNMTSAQAGEPMTPAEKQAMYAPYAAWGLVYDAHTDRLTYQGKSIREFMDVQKSNGESFTSGRFKGLITTMSNDYGEVDITIQRDYARPDAQGHGTIIGIDVQPVL